VSAATPAVRALSRRIVALEAASDRRAGTVGTAGGSVAGRVTEALRRPLVKLAGVAGFRALLSRALALARAEEPALVTIEIRADGALDGLDGLGDEGERAGVVVVSHLLGLLIVFVGEPLVLGLVRDAWPGAMPGEADEGSGRQA
jgi:hypothetical protein